MKNDAKLDASFQGILDKQAEYSIELVNNRDFAEWTISDWPNSWRYEEGAPPPVWDDDMNRVWTGREKLRTTEQVEDAIRVLFWWR